MFGTEGDLISSSSHEPRCLCSKSTALFVQACRHVLAVVMMEKLTLLFVELPKIARLDCQFIESHATEE